MRELKPKKFETFAILIVIIGNFSLRELRFKLEIGDQQKGGGGGRLDVRFRQ